MPLLIPDSMPAINATLNSASTVFLLLGYICIRRRKIVAHAACMISALTASTLFLVSYLIYHFVYHGLTHFDPGLLAISAGYDAHRDDPLAQCMLDEAAYADMAASLRDVAAELGVPVLICLEGGYALGALAASVSATIAAFTGSVAPREAPPNLAAGYRSELRSRWQLA